MERLRARGIEVVAVAEAKKNEVKAMVKRFTYARTAILIISYETFRIHQNLFKKGNQCGLLICDEASRRRAPLAAPPPPHSAACPLPRA